MSNYFQDHELNLLVVTDVHYVRQTDHKCPIPKRKAALGLELTQCASRWVLRKVGADRGMSKTWG